MLDLQVSVEQLCHRNVHTHDIHMYTYIHTTHTHTHTHNTHNTHTTHTQHMHTHNTHTHNVHTHTHNTHNIRRGSGCWIISTSTYSIHQGDHIFSNGKTSRLLQVESSLLHRKPVPGKKMVQVMSSWCRHDVIMVSVLTGCIFFWWKETERKLWCKSP